MKWKIFDYDAKTITLISEKPTTQTLTLEGANGYNNGVHILNKICKDCYSSEDPNLEARSINIEDVRGIMEGGFNANKDVSPNGHKLGESATYQTYNKAPKIWKEFEQGLEDKVLQNVSKQSAEGTDTTYKDEGEMESQENATFYQTFWTNADMTEMSGLTMKLLPWKDEAYEDIMFGANTLDMSSMYGPNAENKMFWLASRFVGLPSGSCSFGLQYCGFRRCGQRRSC